MQQRPARQRKHAQTSSLISQRAGIILALAIAVAGVTAMLEILAHDDPARVALTSLGAFGAAVTFFHNVIDKN
jgi:hypothetical protein